MCLSVGLSVCLYVSMHRSVIGLFGVECTVIKYVFMYFYSVLLRMYKLALMQILNHQAHICIYIIRESLMMCTYVHIVHVYIHIHIHILILILILIHIPYTLYLIPYTIYIYIYIYIYIHMWMYTCLASLFSYCRFVCPSLSLLLPQIHAAEPTQAPYVRARCPPHQEPSSLEALLTEWTGDVQNGKVCARGRTKF